MAIRSDPAPKTTPPRTGGGRPGDAPTTTHARAPSPTKTSKTSTGTTSRTSTGTPGPAPVAAPKDPLVTGAARRAIGDTDGASYKNAAQGGYDKDAGVLAIRSAQVRASDPAKTPAEVAAARLQTWHATSRAAGDVVDAGGGLKLSTQGAAEFIDGLAAFAVTKKMLASTRLDLAAAPVAFVDDAQRDAFAAAYRQRTGRAPDPEAAAWLLPRGDGAAVLVVPTQRRESASAANVLFSMRAAIGFEERGFDAADPKAVVDRVRTSLREVMRGPRDAASMTTLRDLLDHALTADATRPDVRDAVDSVLATMRRVRGKTGASISGAGAPHLLVEKAHASGDPAALRAAHRSDDQQLQALIDGAVAMHDVAGRVAKAPVADVPPARQPWIEATKQALREHCGHAWQRFDTVDVAAFDARVPGAKDLKGVAGIVAAGNAQAPFVAWTERLIDELAERCATHVDPDVRAAFADKRLSTSVLEELCADRARAVGFTGLYTIDPGAGVIPADEFLAILGRGELILDPYFASEQKLGAHGHHSHVLQWLYLAEQCPEAVAGYRSLGAPTEHSANVWDGLFETRVHSFTWSMTPEQLTPMLQAVLPMF